MPPLPADFIHPRVCKPMDLLTKWRINPAYGKITIRRDEVMAVLRFSATIEANEAYYTVPENEEEFMEYVRRVQRDALYDTGLDAAWGQQLLALSTCDRRNNNARIMVIARSMEG